MPTASQAMNELIESSYLTLCKVQKYLMVDLETPKEKPAIGAKAKRLAKELDKEMKTLALKHTRPEIFKGPPFSKAVSEKKPKQVAALMKPKAKPAPTAAATTTAKVTAAKKTVKGSPTPFKTVIRTPNRYAMSNRMGNLV